MEEATQHFVLREEDQHRHAALAECIRRLWNREACQVVRCGRCGFTFAWPYVAGDAEFYNLAYPQASYPKERWEYKRTLQALGSTRGRVLEIGAGRGYFLDQLRVVPSSATAIEYNEASCAILRGKGYTVLNKDVRDLALEPFNTIFLFQVLEHLDGLDELIAKLARLARGDVFLSVPNIELIEFRELHGGLMDMPPNHIGRWTPRAIELAWGRHGFRLLAHERSPVGLLSFVKSDLTYALLRTSQSSRTLANRIRAMRRGAVRRALEVLYVIAQAPSRREAWTAAASNFARLGSTVWAHLEGPMRHL